MELNRSKTSISKEIARNIIILVFFLSVSLAFLLIAQQRIYLVDRLKQSMLDGSEQGAKHVELAIENRLKLLEEVASRDSVRSMDFETQKESLQETVTHLGYLDMAIVRPSGAAYYILQDGVADLSDRAYVQSALSGHATVSDVLISKVTKSAVLMYAVPIFDTSHEVVGALIARRDGNALFEITDEMGYGQDGYAYIVNQEGVVVAHPQREYVMSQFSPIVAAKTNPAYESVATVFSQMLDNQKGVSDYTFEGKDIINAYIPIENTEWILVNTALKKEVFSGINHQMLIMFVTLLFFVMIAIIVAYMMGESIAFPVKQLSNLFGHEASEMSQSDREKALVSIASRGDEIGLLANTFTTYLAAIDQYESTLKHQNNELMVKNQVLNHSLNQNKAILDVVPDMFFVYDSEGYFKDFHSGSQQFLELDKANIVNKHLTDIMPYAIAKTVQDCLHITLAEGGIKLFEYHYDENDYDLYFESRMIKSGENEVLSIVRDITKKKIEEQMIRDLSNKDYLTGLYNRRYFDHYLESIDKAHYLPVAMIVIDINGLKLVNDALGHQKGDEVICKVAGLFESTCPKQGQLFRIGGDEFVMVLPKSNDEIATNLVNKLYHVFEGFEFNAFQISVSVGYAIQNNEDECLKKVFVHAETSMFRRKLLENQSMRHQTITAIIESLNEKSHREKMHSEKVSEWSRKIAEAMNLNAQLCKEIELAGLLHDIGKIAVREDVLDKPGKLSDEEYEMIKKHSESGYQILKSVDAYSTLAESVLAHHERFDGQGYPRGLKGEKIPLIARIIAVADAYDAMVSDRSYRKGIPQQEALKEIMEHAGTQFDPQIVNYFMTLFYV